MKKESLTTQEKKQVALLAAQGLSNNAIAKRMNRHHATTKKELLTPESQVEVADIQERLADKFEQISERILDAICEGDLQKASLQQKSVSAGIMLDKSRLIRGQSTMNHAVIMASAVMEAERLSCARRVSPDLIEAPL
jgi:hypothetical protein